MPVSAAIRQAIAAHHAGRLAEAEHIYRAVLEVVPDQFDALHLLGVLRAQAGHPGEAASLLARAVVVQPAAADAHANYANVLKSLGRLDDALSHCDIALAHKPGHAGIAHIRTGILLDLGRHAEALAAAATVLAADPGLAEAHYHRAVALQALGHAAEALASYDQAIRLAPKLAPAHNNRANLLRLHGHLDAALASAIAATDAAPQYALAWNTRAGIEVLGGRPADALASADRALALQRDFVEALRTRGVALKNLGRFPEALAALDRALVLAPGQPETTLERGFTLAALGRHDEALAVFDAFLAGDGERTDAWQGRAVALQQMGRLDEALAAYDAVLARAPLHVPARNGRAGVLRLLGRHDDALAAWEALVQTTPGLPQVHHNIGSAYFTLGRHADAVAAYDRALALVPDHRQALHNRVAALSQLARFEEALATCDRLLALDPEYAEAHHNRGSVLSSLHRFTEAAAAYDAALARKPDFVSSLQNRASVLAYLGRHDEAARDFAQVLALDPEFPWVQGALLASQLHCCDWRDYETATAALEAAALAGRRASDPLPMVMTTSSPAAQLAAARTYAEERFAAIRPLPPGDRPAHGRIRVAYLSADLHDHATAHLMSGVFERHDRARFETFALSFGPATDDPVQRRLRAAFEHFIDVRPATDAEIAQRLRDLGIDIAVDLKGYTFDARPAIFAYRAAPIQVNYLGYPGTMGAACFDYLVADATVIPPAAHAWYSERVATLPGSYQPNDDRREIAAAIPTRAAAGLPPAGFVFCSFNSNYKITPPVFAVWMRLLAAVPESVLWLLEGNALAPDNLRREAATRGVDPARLVFAPRLPAAEHLARHRLADLFLDTLPVNAHTTASDALWAGVPVVTCTGEAFAGRVAASLLRAAGLADLVTDSLAAYEAVALDLARDPVRLAGVRERLAAGRTTCALFDTARSCRHLEAAYATMWERHLRGEPPAAFAVAAID